MGKIVRLSPELANQIAAGEVVERPASAVKELVENALDAGARRIKVVIEFGGKKLIKVEDDGEGMTAGDAVLALERHATSKLTQLEDLGAISTLGFRGEALPSIASVSRLKLRTRSSGESNGVEIRVDGGSSNTTKEVGMPEGTAIEVADLFYNVPARRKFLKSDSAESTQISRAVTQLALGYPNVGFVLISRGRQLLQCPPVADFKERFFQLYGERSDLVEVKKEAAGVRVMGFVAALVDQGRSRGAHNIFVNRRIIKDRTIAHAIHAAYGEASVKLRNPEVHLFIDLPADRVDVNVHPMKAEVRFLEQSLIHELLRRALGEALGKPTSAQISNRIKRTFAEPSVHSIPGVLSSTVSTGHWSTVTDVFHRADRTVNSANQVTEGSSLVQGIEREEIPSEVSSGAQPLMPLGQFRDTFIIAVDNNGLVVIDQHVAHERILYEQVIERLTDGSLESQRLLEPMLIDLPPGQHQALISNSSHLERLGFEIEPFGGDSFRISAIPSLLALTEAEQAVRAVATDLDGFDSGKEVVNVLQHLAATTACHAAVKANDRLTQEKMLYILQELRRTDYSTICPHGRPIVLRLTRQEIEKSFDRK